jgi:hypothetical protein
MTKDEAKNIKTELKYVISSVEGWVKFGEHYNYEMVLKTLDAVRDRIVKSNEGTTEK